MLITACSINMYVNIMCKCVKLTFICAEYKLTIHASTLTENDILHCAFFHYKLYHYYHITAHTLLIHGNTAQ